MGNIVEIPKKTIYDKGFYDMQSVQSYASAKKVIAVLQNYYCPKSVIDVGCGIGTWLKAWSEAGVDDYKGYDINQIEECDLFVGRDKIEIVDLTASFPTKRVDLVMALEVAEHLPPDYSETFIKNVTEISDIVLFSAALPMQAGANHINTQPLKFWVEIFKKYNYLCFDIIRPQIINEPDVAPWYKQNVLLFVKHEKTKFLYERGVRSIDEPYMYYDSFFVNKIIKKLSGSNDKREKGRQQMLDIDKEKRILVTGGAGFIGFHLVKRLLDLGVHVYIIDNLNDYYDPELKNYRISILQEYSNFTFVKGDIANKEDVENIFNKFHPQIVVNLAAQAGVRYSIEHPEKYVQSNLIGFFNILEACRYNKIDHLIFASSSSVYGANEKVPYCTQDKVDKPASFYAATKGANELMAYSYSKLYSIPSTGLRFFTVYGPCGRPDMAYFKFAKKIINDETIDVYNNGDMYRDFTFIDDIINSVLKIIPNCPKQDKQGVQYKVYNIGNNHPESLSEIIRLVEKHLGKTAKKRYLPLQPGDVYQTFADVTDLMEDFNYKPSTTLDSGIEKFIKWFKEFYSVKI